MAGTVVADTFKSSTANPPTFQNTSGTSIGTLCRAWVQFIGSSAAINASFNVSSITRSAVGSYTVNFSNAMPDTLYNVQGTAQPPSGNGAALVSYSCNGNGTNYNPTTTSCVVFTGVGMTGGAGGDSPLVNIAVFR
jgi:hypothetical protein